MRSLPAIFALLLLAGCATTDTPVVRAPGANMGTRDRLPKIRQIETPQYPDALKQAGVKGVVTIEFVIGEDGRVVSAQAIESPDPRLSALAEAAAVKWTFTPGLRDGRHVATKLRAPITFAVE